MTHHLVLLVGLCVALHLVLLVTLYLYLYTVVNLTNSNWEKKKT